MTICKMNKHTTGKTEKERQTVRLRNALLDAVFTFAAYLLAAFVRFDVLEGAMPAFRFAATPEYLAEVLAYSAAITTAYYCIGLYRTAIFQQIAQVIRQIVITNLLGVLAFTGVLFLIRQDDFSRWTLGWFYIFSTLLVAGRHTIMRLRIRRWRLSGIGHRNAIVVGNGHLAKAYMDAVRTDWRYGFSVIGYVSRREKPELGRKLGAYEDLNRILEQWAPDEVVIALEPHESRMMQTILAACEKQGVRTSIIPFYNDYLPTCPRVDVVGSSKLINVRTIPLDDPFNAMIKRGFDVLASLALLVLTSPVMLAVAIGVRLSSPGPVIFRQERIGLNKKPFRMLKFRSMRMEADPEGWTTDADPRKTRFGSFIRKCSLDELPQLFNVLKGDMSLIGPRPEIPTFVAEFKEEIPLYLVRQLVRPGMTGWAQVNGYRGDTSIEERVKCDIWYIENWSWLLDAKILLRTVCGGMINSEKVVGTVRREEKTTL